MRGETCSALPAFGRRREFRLGRGEDADDFEAEAGVERCAARGQGGESCGVGGGHSEQTFARVSLNVRLLLQIEAFHW